MNRRNKKKPSPGMTWSEKHQMWVDPDTRSDEQKKRDERIAADVEASAGCTNPCRDHDCDKHMPPDCRQE